MNRNCPRCMPQLLQKRSQRRGLKTSSASAIAGHEQNKRGWKRDSAPATARASNQCSAVCYPALLRGGSGRSRKKKENPEEAHRAICKQPLSKRQRGGDGSHASDPDVRRADTRHIQGKHAANELDRWHDGRRRKIATSESPPPTLEHHELCKRT